MSLRNILFAPAFLLLGSTQNKAQHGSATETLRVYNMREESSSQDNILMDQEPEVALSVKVGLNSYIPCFLLDYFDSIYIGRAKG